MEYSLPSTFALIISVLPEKFQTLVEACGTGYWGAVNSTATWGERGGRLNERP